MPLAAVLISPVFVGVAFAAVAALFALHHLRIQPTRLPMATLVFWRKAVTPQQTRVLGSRRFTHRRTFALLAAILVLTAAALTADRWKSFGAGDRRDVVVIDAGLEMAADDGSGLTLFQRAAEATRADLNRLSATPALIVAGDQPTLLSRGDEPAAVVRRRLELFTPGAGASASALALELAGNVQGSLAGDIHWYTAQGRTPADLPEDVAARVRIHPVAPADAVAIVGVTFEPTADDPSHGTLTVRCAGRPLRPLVAQARIDGRPVLSRPASVHAGSAEVAFDHLPADGRSVAIHLIDAPGPATIHSTSFRLPDHRPLTFRFIGNVPLALRAAALTIGTETVAGRIIVAGPGASVPADAAAAIVVVDQGGAVGPGQPLAFAAGVRWGSGLSLEDGIAQGPTLSSPGRPVLMAGAATVAALDETLGHRILYLSQGILGPTADLPRRAAYPVLLDRLCRELTGRSSVSPMIASLRAAQDPLWPGPPDAPEATDASLTLPDHPPLVNAGPAAGADLPVNVPASWHVRWAELVLALALTLTIVEGLLFAARKII